MNETETSQNPQAMISDSVIEAYLLLKHITMNKQNQPLEPEVVAVVVEARVALEKGSWNAGLEARFWPALDKLSTLAHPVTVAGLKSLEESFGEKPWYKTFWRARGRESMATSTILNYQQLALLTLALMLFTQIYWISGNNLLQMVDKNLKEVGDTKNEIQKIQATLTEGETLEPAQQFQLNKQLDYLEELNTRMESSYEMLVGWNKPWQIFVRPFTDMSKLMPPLHAQEIKIKEKERAYIAVRQVTAFALESIYDYFLPLFYGLLGALTFTLQSLNRDIIDRVFSKVERLGLRLRLQLGALSGLAVGWFIDVDSSTSLTPLTLAFLGGYSVDLLFNTMNRLISNFTAPQQAKGS